MQYALSPEIRNTCSDETREKDKLCIVETPADRLVIEGSHSTGDSITYSADGFSPVGTGALSSWASAV